eukprot:SAG22_NODE_1988_length_3201_cov_3.364603_2_plen_127_part_00
MEVEAAGRGEPAGLSDLAAAFDLPPPTSAAGVVDGQALEGDSDAYTLEATLNEDGEAMQPGLYPGAAAQPAAEPKKLTPAERRARAAARQLEKKRVEAEREREASKRMWVQELKAVIAHAELPPPA